jgi:hypothetical protein
MSALIRESHANNLEPLFLSRGGGGISGNVTISGNLNVGGDGTFANDVDIGNDLTVTGNGDFTGDVVVQGVLSADTDFNVYPPAGGTPALQIFGNNGPPASADIRSDGAMRFGTLNLATVPQTTFLASNTPGADVLTIGGALIASTIQGIGPSPVSLINATKNQAPAPVSPAPAVAFGVDTSVPTVIGGEYDVMTRGIITLAAGAPDVDDIVNITLDAGTSAATGAVWTYQFKPSATNANGYWQVRDRIVSDAVVPSLGVTAQVIRAGASTADYNVSQIQFDVTRVI